MSKKAWVSYAWADNDGGDVDFLAQELKKVGIEVKLDRWNISAGKHLWEQIDAFITQPGESDAWVFYATQNSLGSPACREEYYIALDRALKARSEVFPLIAVFPGKVDQGLLPAGIKIRLYVSLVDGDWRERIVAAIEQRAPLIEAGALEPYECTIHPVMQTPWGDVHPVEMRPRAGHWAPCFVGVPVPEFEKTRLLVPLYASIGPKGYPPKPSRNVGEVSNAQGTTSDYAYRTCTYDEECTPTRSLFAYFTSLPTEVIFGGSHEKSVFAVSLQGGQVSAAGGRPFPGLAANGP